jgi:predicted transposase YdaD
MMNLSAAYIKKIEEAKSEGKSEGKLEAALEFLRAGVAADFIAQTLGLSIESIEKLRIHL